ncbi:MAG: DUF4230 domain-containing protein [Bacteroidota bacterium]
MFPLKLILRVLPWVLLALVALIWTGFLDGFGFDNIQGKKETYQNTILTRIEQIGKLELAEYNFQEVTEIKKVADTIDFRLFKFKVAPDSKAVLISQGNAVGCIDLTKITLSDIQEIKDTLYLKLPKPEICYFKIDLEKSRIYDLQINYLSPDERTQFIEELYQVAEQKIKTAALQTGILTQTNENAQRILKPLFESITGKTVILQARMDTVSIEWDN